MNEASDSTSTRPVNADDAFFILRDIRALVERRMGDVARQAGIGGQAVVKAFASAVGEAHDELANNTQKDGFDSVEGLTASRMTLMCDADLELDIRISDSARRLIEHCGNPLWRAHQRYITLLNRPEMKPEHNPIGLETIVAGLWAICNTVDADTQRKLELLDRIEEILKTELPVVYEDLNDFLASRSVEPAQSQIVHPPGGRRDYGGTVPSSGGGSGTDAFAALQQALGRQFGTPSAGSATEAAGGNAMLSAATMVMLNQLTARLEQIEKAGTLTSGATGEAPRALRAADLDLPLTNPEGIALETLSHIFEAIFGIWDLPDTVKTAIGRLQIPLLRLSMADPTLFANDKHPARRLINAMGRAAVGLPRDIPRAHPVSSKIWTISSTVSSSLHGDAGVLAAPLAELTRLIAERDSEILASAAPFIAHLQAMEAETNNVESVRQWLAEIATQPSAREIHDFLCQHWIQVMELAALSGGSAGAAWQEAAKTAADLLWSVQPKADAEDRKRLAGLVPGLIRGINAGLDRIGTPLETRRPFLDACFNLQTASLRGSPPPMVMQTPEETAAAAVSTTATLPVCEPVEGKALCWLALRGDAGATYRPASHGLSIGQWLQISDEQGEQCTGLVSWSSQKLDITLLCNTEMDMAFALTGGYLEQKRRERKVLVVSSRAIFDQAAAQALAQLAKGAT